MSRHVLLLGALLALSSAIPLAQTPAAAAALAVTGDVSTPVSLSAADLKAMPRTTVTVQDGGKAVVYEGVAVTDVLKRAGGPVGTALSGPALASYVRAVASDGYEVLFSISELDGGLTANEIIVADTVDGKPLLDNQGPIRLVVPHDKRGARWVRMLTRLDVVRLKK